MKFSLLAIAPLFLVCMGDLQGAEESQTEPAKGKVHVYKESGGEPQQMEIYFPSGHDPAKDRVPGVILFHGGGWSGGSLSQFRAACEYLASRGLVAATANYQMLSREARRELPTGESRKRVCIMDAKSAIRWFKLHADELGIDPHRVITGGGSAGGHISVLATLSSTLDDPRDPPGIDTSVVAYLLFNPAFSPDDSEDPNVDVMRHLRSEMAPAVVFFGTEDHGWKRGWDAAFDRLRSLGNTTTEVLLAEGEGHSFFNRSPWREQTLIAADRFLVTQGLLEGEPTLAAPQDSRELLSIPMATGEPQREESATLDQVSQKDGIALTLRYQEELSAGSGRYGFVERPERWRPEETALIVCDVWDYHHCLNAVRRLEEFAPRLDAVVTHVRELGGTIIHAPSGCMPAYQGHPARNRAVQTPLAARLPDEINAWCSRIPSEERQIYPIDQSDGGEDDDPDEHAEWAKKLESMGRNPRQPWQRQSDLITIDADRDYISDRGDEIWSVLEKRGIRNVILTGVHVNMCVLGRPFGLRQMARNGMNVVLMRDMTDAMYNPQRWPYVSHFTGNDLIIAHIERLVCPTVTSDQILGGTPFRFSLDTRPVSLEGTMDERTREHSGSVDPESKPSL